MESSNNYKHQFRDFWRLLRVSKVPWYLYIVTFITSAISATLFVQLPIMLGNIMQGSIFDNGQITRYGLLSIAKILFSIFSLVIFNWVGIQICKTTTVSVWNKTIRMKMTDLDRESPSSLISRVTNDPTWIEFAISGIFNCLNILYSTILIYVNMYKMNVSLSNILLIIPFWMLLSIKVVGKKSYIVQKRIQDTYSKLTLYLAERIPNMRIIKSFYNEKCESKMGEQRIQDLYKSEIDLVKVQALSSMFSSVGTALSNAVVLIFGSILVAKGQMELGDMVTFFIFVSTGDFTYNGVSLLNYYMNIKVGLGGISKISQIINGQEEQLEKSKSFTVPEENIAFENVSFNYGDDKVLDNLNLKIPKGKVTAIVGPSGSGKTTVLKLLERFYNPSSGKIMYGTINIDEFHLNEWRESMGYVVQNSPLMAGTIRDNITYGIDGDVSEEKVINAAKLANAYDFIMGLENGFDTNVGELGSKLSGGQRQRIAIARAVIKNPDMLLLDEATCGLDACNEHEVIEALNKFMESRTSVIVAHSMATVRNADNIIVLDNGKIVGQGNHDSLYKSNDLYKKYCDLSLA